jgi:hypothetical protein
MLIENSNLTEKEDSRMQAVPPIRRRGRPPKAPRKETVSFEFDPENKGELRTYRLIGGREILVYMTSKRRGAEERPCCIYCDRLFPKPPASRPLTSRRLKELERRSEKTIEKSSHVMAEAIAKLRRTDQLKRVPAKTDEEYLHEIFSALQTG